MQHVQYTRSSCCCLVHGIQTQSYRCQLLYSNLCCSSMHLRARRFHCTCLYCAPSHHQSTCLSMLEQTYVTPSAHNHRFTGSAVVEELSATPWQHPLLEFQGLAHRILRFTVDVQEEVRLHHKHPTLCAVRSSCKHNAPHTSCVGVCLAASAMAPAVLVLCLPSAWCL